MTLQRSTGRQAPRTQPTRPPGRNEGHPAQAADDQTTNLSGGAHELALFASCPRGLEAPLREELQSLGAQHCQITPGGIAFRGSPQTAMAANLHSRLASRVLMQVAQARYRDEDDLYKLARRIEWEHWFNEDVHLRVDVSAQRSALRSLNFVALRIKDAIVDRFREATGSRPSVDTRNPDVRIFGFLGPYDATVYLDLSGESLFKRGWRSGEDDKGAAPLKENLAAGLIALAGWRAETPLYDPFCGSGTLLIEAAQAALAIAPGIGRSFGFERLRNFDPLAWAKLRQVAEQGTSEMIGRYQRGELILRIAGSDIDPRAIDRTRRNLDRAGIPPGLVALSILDFSAPHASTPFSALGPHADAPLGEAQPPAGLIITNPPYGARIEALLATADDDHRERGRPPLDGPRGPADKRSAGTSRPPARTSMADAGAGQGGGDHEQSLRQCGATLKRAFGGWRAFVLTADPELPRLLGMQARRKTPLFNGALECRLFAFDIFAAR